MSTWVLKRKNPLFDYKDGVRQYAVAADVPLDVAYCMFQCDNPEIVKQATEQERKDFMGYVSGWNYPRYKRVWDKD